MSWVFLILFSVLWNKVLKLSLKENFAELNDKFDYYLNIRKINQIHYGHYLECKTLAEPFYVTGMSLIVEDNTGEIENVMLYKLRLSDNTAKHLYKCLLSSQF